MGNKKRLAILLVAIALLLSACGGAATPAATTAAPATTAATTAKAATTAAATTAATTAAAATAAAEEKLAPYVIKYNLLSNEASEDKEAVEAAINKIIEPLINATIKFNMITWGDWDSKANVPLQAGEKVDITFTADWWNYVRSVSQNQFLRLNDPASEYGDLIGTYGKDAARELGPSFLKGAQIDGYNYSVPTNKELTVPGGYMYNKDLVEKYKIDITTIKNDDDIEPWLAMIKENEPAEIIPFITDGAWNRGPYCEIATEASDFWMRNDPLPDGSFDKTIYFVWEDPVYVAHLKKMHEWYTKGYIHPDAYLNNHDSGAIRKSGKFFFCDVVCKGYDIQSKEVEAMSGNPELRLCEQQVQASVYITHHAGGSMLAIPYTSDDPARAMMYINLMHSNVELINTMVWGIEGKNYSRISDKQVKSDEVTPWISKHGGPWTMGNQFIQWAGANEDPDKYEKLRTFSATGVPHISLGFRFRRDAVDSEITAVKNVRDSMARSLRTGAVDPDVELPKMVEQMKAAGCEKIGEELRRQFEEFLSKQK